MQLLLFSYPIEQLVAELKKYPWDADKEIVTLTRLHLTSVVDRYLLGELTELDLDLWSNAIESREDIGFENGYEEVLREAIHQLANPLLTVPLNIRTAQSLRESIC